MRLSPKLRRPATITSYCARILSGTLLLLYCSVPVQAQSNGYGWNIDSFHSHFTLSSSSAMLVEETIDVTFDTQKHGIFRELPTSYRPGIFKPNVELNVRIKSITDAESTALPYEQTRSNGYVQLQIGDPNVTITGPQQYNITYTLNNAVRFFEDHDELFWDVNGTDWDVGMDQVSATFTLGEPVRSAVTDSRCLTGQFGESGTSCVVNQDPLTGDFVIETTRPLGGNENLSVVLAFEKGTFTAPSTWEQYKDVVVRHAGIVLVTVPAFWIMLSIWRRKGRDIHSNSPIVTQFGPPDDLSPAEVGTLSDYVVDNKDITATVIDLAVHGFIKIIDTTKRDSAKNRKYSFELLTDDVSMLRPHERQLIEGLFSALEKGKVVELKSLKNKFYTTVGKIKKYLYKDLTERRFFAANPNTIRLAYIVVGAVIVVLGAFSAAPTEARYLGWSAGIVLAGIFVIFFGTLMPKRTYRGVRALDHIRGLKQYMEVAEKDRLAMMQGTESRYIGDIAAPAFTVELFEKLLPFALVLGVEKTWSAAFKDIYSEPPEWYAGNWNTFNSALLASRITHGMSTMNSTFVSRPSSSSSSGFSGGGFSGGGFGGGGGGSW